MTDVDAVIANLRRLGALDLAGRIANKYRVHRDQMLGDDRHKSPTAARHELWMVLRHTLALSFPELGIAFQRDHSSVVSGVHKCERALEAAHRKESA